MDKNIALKLAMMIELGTKVMTYQERIDALYELLNLTTDDDTCSRIDTILDNVKNEGREYDAQGEWEKVMGL